MSTQSSSSDAPARSSSLQAPPSPHLTGSSPAPSSDSLSVLENAWGRFSDGVATLQQKSQMAQRRLELEFSALDTCVKSHELLIKEYRKLLQLLDEVEREQGTSPLLSDYRLKLGLLRTSLDRLRDTKPRTDLGWFMRLMVGRVPMTMWKNSEKIKFKDEYNKFKGRTTLIFIVWPLIQLAISVCLEVGHEGKCFGYFTLSQHYAELLLQAHQLWLLYYYTTLSLRENILLANGSNILHWWIYHHYLSMFLASLMLLWPSYYMLNERRFELLCFGLLQGLVMLFQNNYQKKRLYVRKTLGKARAIDVESSETLVEKPTDLKALIPMLFVLYALELWFGFSFTHCFYLSRQEAVSGVAKPPTQSWSVLLMGMAFIVLAIGNAWTTGLVIVSKSRSRQLKQMVQRRISSVVGVATGTTKDNSRNNKTE